MNQNDREFLVQKIRTQYTGKESTALDALKALDKKVKTPANVFAWSFGSVAALLMGSGMSLVMTDIAETLGIAEPMLSGIVVGVVGMAMAIATYPIYRRLLNARRKKYAAEIVALSDRILCD